jgi:hypothetical protein
MDQEDKVWKTQAYNRVPGASASSLRSSGTKNQHHLTTKYTTNVTQHNSLVSQKNPVASANASNRLPGGLKISQSNKQTIAARIHQQYVGDLRKRNEKQFKSNKQ